MNPEGSLEIVFNEKIKVLTAEELVTHRKSKDEAISSKMGEKYSSYSDSSTEKEGVENALKRYEECLKMKRAARMCDLVKAVWNAELNVAFAPNLKGKYVQHMGHLVNGEIALCPEEAVFLLENGCIEIIHKGKPMSTYEAYNVILNEDCLSFEKYQVYSHLSQLGFIVIPHKKELNNGNAKLVQSEKNKRPKRKGSPLPEKQNKRISFQGALSEEPNIFEKTDASVTNEKVDNSTELSQVNNETVDNSMELSNVNHENDTISSHQSTAPAEENANEQQPENKTTVSEEKSNVEKSEAVIACSSNVENVETPNKSIDVVQVENSTHNNIEEMDVDSHSTSNSLLVLEKSNNESAVETTTDIITETSIMSEDSQCAVIESSAEVAKEDHLDDVGFSSDSQSAENNAKSNWIENMWEKEDDEEDEEVTLLEVTKKETTPLAVIDLLSDDENENKSDNKEVTSQSDDEIQIIDEISAPTTSKNKKSDQSPVKLENIKSKKLRHCKAEATRFSVDSECYRLPELFQKDMVCVARPPIDAIPHYVKPVKEAYIINIAAKTKKQNRQSHQARPPQRVWESYRDIQDYQQARHYNRHGRNQRYQNQECAAWYQRNFGNHDNHSRDSRQRNNYNDLSANHTPVSHHRDRHDRTPYYNKRNDRMSRNQHNESAFSEGTPLPDHKPFIQSISPMTFGNMNEQRTFPDNPTNSLQFPQFISNSLMTSIRPSMNVGYQSVNTINSISSSNMSHNPNFVAEVQRTAYSYATNMLSSLFGASFNPNSIPPFSSFPGMRNGSPFPIMAQNQFNENFNFNSSFNLPMPNREYPAPHERFRRGDSFPCQYRNLQNKTSWDDVSVSIDENDKTSDKDNSDIEEIPIELNDFLWNVSNICPLIKSGINHKKSDVLNTLRLTKMAMLTDKNIRNDKIFPTKPALEISFDVYLPGKNFKKSSPGIPKHRIVILRALERMPRYSEIAILQRNWNDGAMLQIAAVDGTDIQFCSFNNLSVPDLIPFEE